LVTEADSREIAEARLLLARYLSDEVAPMIFADAAEILFKSPPEVLAREIHSWVGIQLQGTNASAVSDYLLHSARKVQNLGELELIPKEELNRYLARLQPLLVSICPERDRADLSENLSRLGVGGGEALAARISVSRSPQSGGGGGGGGGRSTGDGGGGTSAAYGGGGAPQSAADIAEQVARSGAHQRAVEQIAPPPEIPRQESPHGADARSGGSSAANNEDQTTAHIDRLNLLLDRWERVATKSSTQAPAGLNTTLAGAENALLSRIIDEVATSAGSSSDLNNQLRYLKDFGVNSLGDGVMSALSGSLPDWAPSQAPSTTEEDAPPLSGAAETMRKVMELSKDPAELNERFRELITTAVGEFNSGSLGRAVTVIDLANRMITTKEVDASLAANIIDQASEDIDEAQLRIYSENDDKRLLLRRVLNFFPSFQIDGLMQGLIAETRRDRRRMILRLLMIHGDETRDQAIKILDDSLSGNVPQPWYVQRNLIYLVRSIPPTEEDDVDKEIDLLVRSSVPGGELPLLREALTALGQIDHPRSIKTLVARVSDLEDVLLQKGNAAHKKSEIQSLLDTAIKALIRFENKEARQCVVTHGLKRRPEFGDSLARLAMLNGQDLSDDPTTINSVIEAIKAELPVKVFGVSVKTPRKAQNIGHLLESLSGTDIPKVRMAYDSIVRKFPGEQFANAAAKALTKLDNKTPVDQPGDAETITSLSGDLALFGLPNLMQNLADSRVEGILTVLDDSGNSTASITLSDGMMIEAAAGKLTADTAVYQLLERPILGRFIFVNQPVDLSQQDGQTHGTPVMSLLMEGMRRYDEFNRAAAIIPDEGQFAATGKQPTGLPDEDDANFVNGIWVQATKGATPIEIEKENDVDGYRVFRLFEHWVNEGALEPKS
jgi:Domain of unknown function (DUF4388)